MVALCIIGAVLLLLILVTLLPISLSVKYRDEFSLTAKIGFIPIKKIPSPKKKVKISDYSVKAIKKRRKKAAKAKAKAEKKKTPPTPQTKKAPKKKKNLFDTLNLIKELLGVIIPGVWGKLKIKASKISITVGSEDAAKTALLFSAVNNGVAGVLAYLDNASKIKGFNRSEISVRADFLAENISADIDVSFSLRIGQILKILFDAALKYVKSKIKK
ncbi:MAG: hypothetical protein IJW79_06170 [Clostridia bacterium]|nr:hypothetical protein [Clostridia bacterium]